MAEPPTTSVYDSVPLPLRKTMCIRVIKIRPSTTSDFSDTIVCDFSVLDIDNGTLMSDGAAPEPPDYHTYVEPPQRTSVFEPVTYQLKVSDRIQYQAVSYTWGEAPADLVIELSGKSFSARRNLWEFLSRARRNNVTGYLWIDAIGINQATNTEKNHQVSIMGEIYSRAECVIVWLGDCNPDMDRSVGETFGTINRLNQVEAIMWERSEREKHITHHISNLPYWRRVWIVQEYYLAKRKRIWYGSNQTNSDCIEKLTPTFPSGAGWVPTAGAATILGWNIPRNPQRAFNGFLTLLNKFGNLNCADPRDKIYGLLSLLSPDERQGLGISPDYSKTATDLFLGIMSTLLRGERLYSESLGVPYNHLVRILAPAPDLQDREVQCLILDLAASGIQISYAHFKEVHHQCGSESDLPPVIGSKGCLRCHLRPVVRFDGDWLPESREADFSRANWRQYAWALLKSEDGLDIEYGTKLLKDPKLRLDIADEEYYCYNYPYLPKRPETPVLMSQSMEEQSNLRRHVRRYTGISQ